MLEDKEMNLFREQVEKVPQSAQAIVLCWVDDKGEGAVIPIGDVKTIFFLKEQFDVMVRDRFLRPTLRQANMKGINVGIVPPPGGR